VVAAVPSSFPPAFGAEPPVAPPPARWTVLDLFSGAGGMSWGFASLESHFQVIGAVDAERAKPGRTGNGGSTHRCNPSYEANIGITPWADDLAALAPEELRRRTGLERGELDVLVSCAPCTGFSQKLAINHGHDDRRNALVRRTALFVKAFEPRVLVMENVKELLNGRHRHHFLALRAALTAAGYSVSAEVHNLADFGLPQRRHRALVVGRRDGEATLPQAPRPARPATTVREAIGHLPAVEQGIPHPSDPMHVCPRHTPAVQARIEAIPRDGGSWGDIAESNPELLIPSMVGKRAGSFPDVYGRLAWDRPAVTITRECGHPGNGRYLHPEQDRLLTVREMALLQGFPPGYRFLGPLSARYNQVGDAVPPLVSRRLAGHVAGLLAAHSRSSRLSNAA
jgi:DNA (cytosine-5)-methyltransferase 1